MIKFMEGVALVVSVLVLIGLLALLLAFPTMWAANYLFSNAFITFVFGSAKLTFWKAFILNFLVGYLQRSESKTEKK